MNVPLSATSQGLRLHRTSISRKLTVLPTSDEVDSSASERVLTGVSKVSQKESAPSLVVVETVANDHDLDTERDSLVYGREMSFSHNYPHLIERADWMEVKPAMQRL